MNEYLTTVSERSGRLHVTIERRDGKSLRCGWDRIQAILREAVGPDETLVEYFPASRLVVDEINRRHFWSTHEPLPF